MEIPNGVKAVVTGHDASGLWTFGLCYTFNSPITEPVAFEMGTAIIDKFTDQTLLMKMSTACFVDAVRISDTKPIDRSYSLLVPSLTIHQGTDQADCLPPLNTAVVNLLAFQAWRGGHAHINWPGLTVAAVQHDTDKLDVAWGNDLCSLLNTFNEIDLLSGGVMTLVVPRWIKGLALPFLGWICKPVVGMLGKRRTGYGK